MGQCEPVECPIFDAQDPSLKCLSPNCSVSQILVKWGRKEIVKGRGEGKGEGTGESTHRSGWYECSPTFVRAKFNMGDSENVYRLQMRS